MRKQRKTNEGRLAGHSVLHVRTRHHWRPILYGNDLNGPVKVYGGGQLLRTEVAVDPRRYPSKRMRLSLLVRDGYQCRYCRQVVSSETAQFDHRKPWKFGGKTNMSNLVTCCPPCNKAKGNRVWRPRKLPQVA